MQRLFYENVNLCFENIYEAGYSYKYKNEIWKPQNDIESSISDKSPSSKNTSYKERGKSFQLTKRTRDGSANMTPRNNPDNSKKKLISKKDKNSSRCC